MEDLQILVCTMGGILAGVWGGVGAFYDGMGQVSKAAWECDTVWSGV